MSSVSDFSLSMGSFAETTAKVEAVSAKAQALFAKMYGAGAVAVELPKSKVPSLAAYVRGYGLQLG